jgi:hypothetical protein
MGTKNDLKKALHKAIMKAYESGKKSKAVRDIVNDIRDPDYVAEVSPRELPAPSESVLHKDVTLSELHQKKQANAMAQLGQPIKPPSQKGAFSQALSAPSSPSDSSKPPKGLKPLKSFMQKRLEKGGRCWEGYEPVPGKKPYSKGSCRPKK